MKLIKRVWLFLRLCLFTADYLHQAYTHKSTETNDYVFVEFVVNGRNLDCGLPITRFSFFRVLWCCAEQSVL